jgi:hypothetical protein
MVSFNGDSILQGCETCVHCVEFYTIPYDLKSDVMGEHPSLLSGCASTRVYIRKAADDRIFLRS